MFIFKFRRTISLFIKALYFTVIYICLMELSSLAENCAKLGVEIPEKLKEKLNNDKEE